MATFLGRYSSSHLIAGGFRHACKVLVNWNLKNMQSRDRVINICVFQLSVRKDQYFFITISNLSLHMTWYTVHTCEYVNMQTNVHPFNATRPLIQAWLPRLNVMAMSCCCKIFCVYSLFLYLSCQRPVTNCSWALSNSDLHFPYRSMTFNTNLWSEEKVTQLQLPLRMNFLEETSQPPTNYVSSSQPSS